MTSKIAVTEVLQNRFGLDAFRRGQLEIISSILNKQDTLAVMPTGGGKSLCYQLPALCQVGVTLVISPLISLMRDQVQALQSKGIPAGCIHSGMTMAERRNVFNDMGKHESFILYLSPERVQKDGFSSWYKNTEVSLIAIDEAHCVSQWGHDFRPDYGRLTLLRELKPKVPILASTATATPQVLGDISKQLTLEKPAHHIYGFYRPNLYYQVEICDGEAEKLVLLHSALSQSMEGKVIIYCGTRKKCEELHDQLSEQFSGMDFYHAGLSSEDRNEVQDRYEKGETRILLATNAFGMGIDHPDVRLIVHFNMPANIESYYQEIGRAGRDGRHSTCLLLYAKKDKGLQSFFIMQSKAPPWIKSIKWNTLEAMVQYSEGGECRHEEILTYFRDEQRITGCGHCDTCAPTSERKIRRLRASILRKSVRSPKEKKKSKKKDLASPLTDEETSRMKVMKQWRLEYARAKDIPAFLVFSNKTLDDLARRNPHSMDQLQNVYGIGPQKIEAFGEELIEVLTG